MKEYHTQWLSKYEGISKLKSSVIRYKFVWHEEELKMRKYFANNIWLNKL